MKKILFGLVLFIYSLSFSQTQNGAYTAVGKGVATTFLTDYQCLGVNASALGYELEYEKKSITFGTSEFAGGINSTALNKDKLRDLTNSLKDQIFDENSTSYNWEQQKEAVADYAQQGISMHANYNWFGASFQNRVLGGIAVQVREKYNWFSELNEETTDLIFRGQFSNYFDSLTVVFGTDTSTIANRPDLSSDTLQAVIQGNINVPLAVSEITAGSKIKLRWDREWNIGYGRKVFGNPNKLALYVGVSARYIQSMAYFDLESDGNNINVRSSISPTYNINYGVAALTNPSAAVQNIRNFPENVGRGYGYDLSASVKMAKIFTFAASVNNIGSVTFDRNVYEVKDTLLGNLSINALSDGNITESINQLVNGNGLLTLVGKEEYKVKNAANFRLGGSIKPFKMLNVGIDIVAPFDKDAPGNIQNAIISVGGDFRPFKWLQISAGYFGGGIYQNNIPVGINFILKDGGYEFGISSADALNFFTQDSNSLSTAFGFARFRI
ncbi:MAG: DUF5723 family protein [Lishizhenia sp.]